MARVQDGFEALYREHAPAARATLIRLLGDFELAEDALHEAWVVAMQSWVGEDGALKLPTNPRAWLISTARFKGIDRLRRRVRYREKLALLAAEEPSVRAATPEQALAEATIFEDDRLRLIFTCCHPALGREAQVALTLREVCGLSTEEIARAFLVRAPTLAQRIVRAKRKIQSAKIPYAIPEAADIPMRLEAVLSVIYLVFNEGYAASSGDALIRRDLCTEAIGLGRLVVDLLDEPDGEALGLLALMLLSESRREARADVRGDLVLLEDQDRALWDRGLLDEGQALVGRAFATGEVGSYALQAAIAAVHARAERFEATDWAEIVALYDLLLQASHSSVVALNRAVAIAMRDGPAVGLTLVEGLMADETLTSYYLAHAALADLYRRVGRDELASAGYRRALELTELEPERRFLVRRLRELEA
ncbi:sigma-70 family RNA polymerase sigma factor [Lujinxingia sediminis]|uniref:Sigma-70 family RNA polymerase sigma factor n=1 Tax=Lujinxingia sediminis TaxID=2480984 RepID=A0ABY0CRV1_9DELT|nr:sigma-70 family RNA polymerase sigma factor [Lujinxingia sediminis]RVU43518.1 sigma-70 family RNA polymerase sigma factor [Lujinxingia sediminis]